MEMLDKHDSPNTHVPEMEQPPACLSSHNMGSGCSILGCINPIHTQEQLENLAGFAVILKRIHVRLITEGYVLKDGKFTKPVYEGEKNTSTK